MSWQKPYVAGTQKMSQWGGSFKQPKMDKKKINSSYTVNITCQDFLNSE